MNGIGSGNWQRNSSKRKVDDCLTLDVNKLIRDSLIQEGAAGTLNWTERYSGKRLGSISFFNLPTGGSDSKTLEVNYRWSGSVDISTRITLESTRPHFGGRRWWFLCPNIKCESACGNRVAKLHLSSGYFGCRSCHDLTYLSCQRSRQLERLLAQAGFDETGSAALMDRFTGTDRLRSFS